MTTVHQNQNVANSPTNAYPVGVFKMADGTELQAVVLVNSSGVESSISTTGVIDIGNSKNLVGIPVQPASGRYGLDPVSGFCWAALNNGTAILAEAGSTTTVINATGHIAQPGDVLSWIYWINSGLIFSFVKSVTTNTITLFDALPQAPVADDEFQIMRRMPIQGTWGNNGGGVIQQVAPPELPGQTLSFNGKICDGTTNTIKATVRNYAGGKPLAVALTNDDGDYTNTIQVSAAGGSLACGLVDYADHATAVSVQNLTNSHPLAVALVNDNGDSFTATDPDEAIIDIDNTAGGTQLLAYNVNHKVVEVRVSLNSTQGVYIQKGNAADIDSRFYAPGDYVNTVWGNVIYNGPMFGWVPSGAALVEIMVLT